MFTLRLTQAGNGASRESNITDSSGKGKELEQEKRLFLNVDTWDPRDGTAVKKACCSFIGPKQAQFLTP